MTQAVVTWAKALVAAVDVDNTTPGLRCGKTATLAVLRAAPKQVAGHAGLTVEDFTATADQELPRLRSDVVAHRFAVSENGANVMVARMTVPGGPWPGHFGLEAVAFTAFPARMPEAFPTIAAEAGLHFGQVLAASRAFRAGSGAVLFPEQLAVRTRPNRQAFGVVFLDKLVELFHARVLPVLDEDALPTADRAPWVLRDLRRLAFLAHEWGHLAGISAEQTVRARRRRLVAVVSELHADLAALAMLDACPMPRAEAVARVLVADRIVRQAWLRRPYAQVDAIAARQLLALLTRVGAVALGPNSRVRLNLDTARNRLVEELERVRAVERACCAAGPDPAGDYLRKRGWALVDQACHRELEDPLARFLGYPATGAVV
ncbi:MAG: hypothetical protein ACRDS1_10055 [Pseudonocardiaceae bacterium]